MTQLTPRFSANHTMRKYTEQHYLPASTAYHFALPIMAQSAGKWSIGSTVWNRNGPSYTLAK
jgi:glycogen phosphorylase